jgi:hypothetical protein
MLEFLDGIIGVVTLLLFIVFTYYASRHPKIKILKVFAVFSLLYGLVELMTYAESLKLIPYGPAHIPIGIIAIYMVGIIYRMYKCGHQSLTEEIPEEIQTRKKCGLFVYLEAAIMFVILFWISGIIELYSVFFLGATLPSLRVAFFNIFDLDIGIGMLIGFIILLYYARRYPSVKELRDLAAILFLFGLAEITGFFGTLGLMDQGVHSLFNIAITLYLIYLLFITVSRVELDKLRNET